MKRGERKARAMLDALDRAGVRIVMGVTDGGELGFGFPDAKSFTAEQREVAVEVTLFAIGYPRCFGTLKRLIFERGARE